MNDFILINVRNNINRFINKCNKYNIVLLNINYVNNDEIIVKVKKSDLKNIKIYNYFSEVNIYRKIGKDKLIEKIYNLKYFIFTFILCLIVMYFISNIILNINVIHSNKKIRELLYSELQNYGIKKYSLKKDFNELEEIKNNILENNKDTLEWISITNIGMKYVVRVEERILDEITESNNYCDIVALKDSFITNIYATSGEVMISVNDYVHKGDLLISGDIYLNEEKKGITCADGIVKGKIWYNTSITIDRVYYKKEYTGEKRYNLTINNKVLRKNKYPKYDKDYLVKNKLFSIYKELEYKNIKYEYSDEEGIYKALKELENKYKDKLGDTGKIIETKILSQDVNNKNITLKVFVVTEENIGKRVVKSEISE